ncbi:ABC transporter ATP-binding protein [Uliginosibacterium sp. 31-16]|uniref:dipeptide ABC transporter ATP-binding protein n=1 Tax=Uliginosibacterium sp. 31-16 TaxID=3068315 RepID=UPI00273D41B3|nr:ABC transporter ATP-binding protein [Uliginosibacterium sp. 31-16]MDP5240933.1 ABC transporter ATP-binding protein [Uliginosibacterium sp. 31-16]
MNTSIQTPSSDIILDVRNLKTYFGTGDKAVKAVDDISFKMMRGKTLCIVGESGSGKSVTARSILQIVDPPGKIMGGDVLYYGKDPKGQNLAQLHERSKEIRSIRGHEISMIFQEPMTSLSPIHTIGNQIMETILLHQNVDKAEARARAIELLRRVEIPNPGVAIDKYTFEYSGGMRQRAMIAMSLACNPKILIADEPTTALDVTTQAEILALIKELQTSYGMAVLFITHDMGVVAEIADEIGVMQNGKMLEFGSAEQIFYEAKNPYTLQLIDSVRKLETSARAARGSRATDKKLMEIRGVSKIYPARSTFMGKANPPFKALDNVSLDVFEGENLGIVGESGSGKTTLGNCVIRVLSCSGGEVLFRMADGRITDLAKAKTGELRQVHREIRMVFQDPFASLNPRMTIGQIVGEPLLVAGTHTGEALRKRTEELLETVGIPGAAMERYPHAFSGGQRQRIGIARALALNPRLIIADEATSALDVTLRSQVLDLLLDLQDKLSLSFILVSHDIGVIRYFCDRVAVMYKGQVVEHGPAMKICSAPDHPYTKALISAVPGTHPRDKRIVNRHRYDAEAQASGIKLGGN